MAGTLPILKIRSSNFLVGLLTAIPMTCYNERKIFKILKFLTHPTVHTKISYFSDKFMNGKFLKIAQYFPFFE